MITEPAAEVQPAIDQLKALFTEAGRPTAWPSATLYAGPAARLAGDLQGSEDQLREGLAVLWDQWRNSSLGCSVMTELARTMYEAGGFDEAERLALRGGEIASDDDIYAQSDWRAIVAKVAARSGRTDQAIRLGREAVAISDPSDYLDFRGVWRCDLAEVLVLSGRQEEAGEPLGQAIAMFEQKGNLVMASRSREFLSELTTGRLSAGSSRSAKS